MRVGAVLLAAGGSRRLGQPKQLLDIDGVPLVRRIADRLAASTADELVVVLGARADAVGRALPTDLPRVVNGHWRDGQASSVRIGIERLCELSPPVDAALFVPCDQPRLTTSTLDRLIDAYRVGGTPRQIVVPVYGEARHRGAPVLFGRPFFESLRALEGDTGGRVLLSQFPDAIHEVPIADARQADDIDTIEDWRRLTTTEPDR